MSTWSKLKELQLWKAKKYIVLGIVELLLMVWGICSLFGKNHVYEYGLDEATIRFGEYSEEKQGQYVDSTMGVVGNIVDFEHIYLPRGHYIVSLQYETDTDYSNMCTVTAEYAGFHGCLTNGSGLHAALNETDFDMWLLRDTDHIIVHASYNEGMMLVKGLTIRETNVLNRMALFTMFVLISLLNGILCFGEYDRHYRVQRKTKNVMFGLGLITIFASLPVFTDYILSSGDVGYHLNRIEGLKDGILSGQFPVRIAPRWLEDNGYASAIFYPETMLLPAALFRMIGFTVTASYCMYMIFLNFLTAAAACYCFGKMFQNAYIGLVCSMLHTLSIYRIFNTYTKGSLGETLAMLFLPFIVYGFYRVFTEDYKAKEYKWSFVPLTIGFCGLIQTHLLTCELVGGFTILLCLVLWKRVLRKETFAVLAKTVIWSALICAWFLVPFLDYMITGDFVIHNVSARTIQERGLYIAHLFMTTPFYGGNTIFQHEGMVSTAAVGIGFALLVVLLIWLYLWFTEGCAVRKQLSMGEFGFGKIASIFAVLAMIMSLNIFPWDWIQSKHSILATLVSSLQFPTRVLTIASVLLVALAGVVCKYIMALEKSEWKHYFAGGLCVLTIITSMLTLSDHLYKGEYVKIYNAAGMGYGYISGAEYLPYGTDQTKIVFRNPQSSEAVVIESYEKSALRVDVTCRNEGTEEGVLTLPLLYYKGYQAYDVGTGEKLEAFDGDNHSVSVVVPVGFDGEISTRFVSPWYWRVAEVITLLSASMYIILYKRDKRKGLVG